MFDVSGTALASDSFCERCAKFDFEEWFFPSLPVGGSNCPHDGLLDWKAVIKNYKRCAFCRVLIYSLVLQPRFKQIRFTGNYCGIYLLLVETGKVKWRPSNRGNHYEQLNGHGWIRGKDAIYRSVRHLLVQGHGGGTSVSTRIYPYADKYMSARGKLLLSRLIPPSKLDLTRIEAWLLTCGKFHTEDCDWGLWADMAGTGIRMIDVQSRCITIPDRQVSYCAISYCRGTKPFLNLTSANIASLFKKNSLSVHRSDLPETIKDAMALTLHLGVRYLWVDALCILQDDASDKEFQLPLMEKIYKHALLTIVDAAGSDPSNGLPGMRPRTRDIKQITQRVGSVSLYASTVHLTRSDTISRSSWAKRAWTLQEHALSTRLLIFTPTEVFWECKCCLWNEGAHYETADCQATKIELSNTAERTNKPSRNFSPFQKYAFFTNQVSSRKLSFESDRIDCMRGLLEDMSRNTPGGFIWGHPVAAFESSLLFSARIYVEAPHVRRDGFPSWSWAGWQTVTFTNVTSPYDTGFSDDPNENKSLFGSDCPKNPSWIRREVAWFHLNDAGNHWRELNSSWISQNGSAFYAESMNLWKQSNTPGILINAKKKLLSANIPPSQALAFWTQSVYLSVDRQTTLPGAKLYGIRGGGGGSCNGYPVRDNLNRIIGAIKLTAEYRRSMPDKLHFILIAQNRRWEHKLGPLLDLLHVQTVSGVTFRAQVIRDSVIRLDTWSELKPKWELIIMA